MTTVAFRDGVIAADTLGIKGVSARRICKKLWRMENAVIGFAGNYQDGVNFVEWWRKGHNMSELPKFIQYRGSDDAPDFTAIVLTKAGAFEWTEHFQSTPIPDEFYAVGSGQMAALAAMVMGASADEAVRIASQVDVYTGTQVETMSLK